MFIVIHVGIDYVNEWANPIEVISKHRTKSAAIKNTIKAMNAAWPWDEMSKEEREKILVRSKSDLEEKGEAELFDETFGEWQSYWVIREI